MGGHYRQLKKEKKAGDLVDSPIQLRFWGLSISLSPDLVNQLFQFRTAAAAAPASASNGPQLVHRGAVMSLDGGDGLAASDADTVAAFKTRIDGGDVGHDVSLSSSSARCQQPPPPVIGLAPVNPEAGSGQGGLNRWAFAVADTGQDHLPGGDTSLQTRIAKQGYQKFTV